MLINQVITNSSPLIVLFESQIEQHVAVVKPWESLQLVRVGY